jgi:hypothetical protein
MKHQSDVFARNSTREMRQRAVVYMFTLQLLHIAGRCAQLPQLLTSIVFYFSNINSVVCCLGHYT